MPRCAACAAHRDASIGASFWQVSGSVLTRAQGRVPYQQLRSAADRYRCRISPRTSDREHYCCAPLSCKGATFFSHFATRWLQAVEKTVLAWLPIWILTLLAAFVRIVSQRSISPLVNLPFYSGLPLWQCVSSKKRYDSTPHLISSLTRSPSTQTHCTVFSLAWVRSRRMFA